MWLCACHGCSCEQINDTFWSRGVSGRQRYFERQLMLRCEISLSLANAGSQVRCKRDSQKGTRKMYLCRVSSLGGIMHERRQSISEASRTLNLVRCYCSCCSFPQLQRINMHRGYVEINFVLQSLLLIIRDTKYERNLNLFITLELTQIDDKSGMSESPCKRRKFVWKLFGRNSKYETFPFELTRDIIKFILFLPGSFENIAKENSRDKFSLCHAKFPTTLFSSHLFVLR